MGRLVGVSLVVSLATVLAVALVGRALLFVPVPPVEVGTVDVARAKAEAKGLSVFIAQRTENAVVDEGKVLSQAPAAGTRVPLGSVVLLEVSTGSRAERAIPALTGLSFTDARTQLVQAGLSLGEVIARRSDKAAPGHVLKTDPGVGEKLPRGAEVDLYLSMGAEKVKAPSVTNRSLSRARSILRNAGLKVGKIRRRTNIDRGFGVVLGQSPNPGTQVPLGSGVNLTVNSEDKDDEW